MVVVIDGRDMQTGDLVKTTCHAVQQSDEMFCARCDLRWDVSEPKPTQCRPTHDAD